MGGELIILNNRSPEKDIVLNMIRLAALGEEGAESLPTRPASREHRSHVEAIFIHSLIEMTIYVLWTAIIIIMS